MNLPFGLQFKSLLIGALIAMFILPRVLAWFTSMRESK